MNHPTERSGAMWSNLFSRSFTLNWEVALYIAILLLAIFTRFFILGERVMSHDESLHTRFSWNLYAEGNFQHSPLMHGPILFHATALSYSLFGDSDFSARIYTSVLGVLLVMTPVLFRRWIGRWGAILASLMLLISPLIMYYGRYIRHDTPSMLAALLMIWAAMMYLNGPQNQQRRAHWLYLIAVAMIWNLGSKETAFIYIAIIGIFLALYFGVRLLQYFLRTPGKPIFYVLMIGIFLGGVMSMGMYIILDIVQFDLVSPTAETTFGALSASDQQTFFVWTALVIGSVILVALGTLFWAFRDRLSRIPWLEVVIVLVIALLVCGTLIVMEEVSHTTPTSSEPVSPVVPGEDGEADETFTTLRWWPMLGVWVVSIAGIVFLVITRLMDQGNSEDKDKYGRGFWGTLDLFPEFDLIVVIGTLILPWATAFVPYFMRGTQADYAQLANSLPPALSDFIATYVPRIATPEQIGQFMLHVGAWLPLMVLAITLGLMWNWKRWLIAATIFHLLFAFFFTTIFTNISGLATGMVYSLGYWLEQQGVRRGSQPQYYYLLLIMPFYEFLPVIGGVFSMFAGMTFFWRWRKDTRHTDVLLAQAAAREAGDEDTDPDAFSEDASTAFDESAYEDALTDEPEAAVYGDPIDVDKKTKNRLIGERYRQKVRNNPLMIIFLVVAALGLVVSLLTGLRLIFLPGSLFVILVAIVGLRLQWVARREVEAELAMGMSLEAISAGGLPRRKRDAELARDLDSLQQDPVELALRQERSLRLDGMPFLLFFAWLAILNLVGYSLAGEKMPWLGTHLTLPLIFLSGWFFGRILDRLNWQTFKRQGWIVGLVLVVFFVGLFQSVYPLLIGTPPFSGLTQEQLQVTYGWFAAVIIMTGALAAIFYLSESVGWKHVLRLSMVAVFAILSVITFRSAWLASFINYDYPTEFLVYAHAAPGVKWVLEEIEELSLRTTDGYDLRIAYDNEVSWPYSWYFRNYNNVVYVGENPTVQNLQDAVVVVVGAAHLSTVEPILEDRYVRFDHMRLWWPMQDYFYLTPDRVQNALDLTNPQSAQIRQGMFDIWWSRDYSTYGAATNHNYNITEWPVSDRMHFYVRRDVAAQIWPYGVGEGTVANPLDDVDQNQCTANWQDLTAEQVLQAPDGMNTPIGIAVAEDGTVYVAEEFGHRISVFSADGEYIDSYGQQGTALDDGLFLTRPNSLAIGPDGNLFVADTWNFRIQMLSSDFTPLITWGQGGTFGFDAPVEPRDGFWGPRDLAVDSEGRVYVSDTGNKRVRVYVIDDNIAIHQYDIGEGGSGLGQLDEPSGVVVHPDGRLFVADTWNRRISVFTREGVALDSYRVRGWYEEQGNRPYIALDVERDLLYVTDPDSGRVLVYTTAGDCVGSFGQPAAASPTLGQFGVAAGVAVGPEGNVYVVDSQLGRVLRFAPFEYVPPAEEASEGAASEEVSDAEGNDVVAPDEDNNVSE